MPTHPATHIAKAPQANALTKALSKSVSAKRTADRTLQQIKKMTENKEHLTGNISYPSSAAAVVFGWHLSARAVFRLDRKSPAIRPCV
jgi:hypothetical protein